MNRIVARMVVIALLAAFLTGNAAALCVMSSPASPAMPPCHHRLPASPHPTSHQCCVARAPSAVPISVFSAAPVVHSDADAFEIPQLVTHLRVAFSETSFPFSPPSAVALKI